MRKAVVVLIAGCMMTSSAWAARLIEGTVTHDGIPILTVIHTANDSTPAAYLFRQVSGWQATEAGRKLLADGKQKVINGNITISLKHVDRVLVEATVKELELKAGKEQASWDLTPGSVEKVAQAAGLEPVGSARNANLSAIERYSARSGKAKKWFTASVCSRVRKTTIRPSGR